MESNKYSYLQTPNSDYIDELFQNYLKDPNSVDESWKYFFDGMEFGLENTVPAENGQVALPGVDLSSEAKVADLINYFRSQGKSYADLDPLGIQPRKDSGRLDLSAFGLSQSDMDRTFTAGKLVGLGTKTLREIMIHLKATYCNKIAVEFWHIEDKQARDWLSSRMEACANREQLDVLTKKKILKRLVEAETFERFLHTRYVAQKRFSIEGGESLIPTLDRIIDIAGDLGANNIVMGMAHRGRLNVLVNLYGKKPEHVLTEFEQGYQVDTSMGEGDVKYHMGYSADINTESGKSVHLSLASNPSHLEFVNPVVEGVARAKQKALQDSEGSQVIPILIHGDAAFAGQGINYETINLSQIPGYFTGGTIHIVTNNQVGFTTSPQQARSTTYATDLAKMLSCPIFHVNGDDPEAVWYVARLATEFRQTFKRDVFIDLICYRKHGHNEGDEPSFTQPLMYKTIKTHPSTRELYAQRLVAEGVLTEANVQEKIDAVIAWLTDAQTRTREEKPRPFVSAFQSRWQKLRKATEDDVFEKTKTSVSKAELLELNQKLNVIPSAFRLHPKLNRFFEARKKTIEEGAGIDWGTGEALAYASLLKEGHSVRICGQDVERGTFTHRHAVINDYETGEPFCPLKTLGGEGVFSIHNSTLSESGVLGFEYGYSLADPNSLVIWEAQFGDFVNGAQVIIDQFIVSSESKWQRATGLVLYLPHGYEGQGPEHSSARLERFLQLCGKNNMIVCNLTNSAQLFHALRRQLKRDFRKPMVLMSPKSLLRHPKAVASLEDFSDGSFQEVIDDVEFAQKSNAKRVLLCSGKIYYEILAARELHKKQEEIPVIRLEQMYPWPEKILVDVLSKYKNAKEFVWVQEEPANMGAWTFVFSSWKGALSPKGSKLSELNISYAGRDAGAAPAVGSHKLHQKEQEELIRKALQV